MNKIQYQIILNLYHEYNTVYHFLPYYIKDEFQDILFGRKEAI